MLIALLAVATGCGDRPATPSVAVSTFTATAVPTLTPAQFVESRKFRETFGIRADDLWISIVSADPSSQEGTEMFGVPLLPSELRQLLARNSTAADAGAVIIEYGLTVPDDWHGSYIDQARGAIVVAEFYRNADRHRAAIARLLSPAARWEVREVDPLVLDQIAFVERVKAERAWFETIDAELLDVVTNPMDGGIVELTYKAVRRDLDVAIREHFGAPDWLRVDWAGAPPWTGPLGDLVILAVDAQGRPTPTKSVGKPRRTRVRGSYQQYLYNRLTELEARPASDARQTEPYTRTEGRASEVENLPEAERPRPDSQIPALVTTCAPGRRMPPAVADLSLRCRAG